MVRTVLNIKEAFSFTGLKQTPQRLAILEYLNGNRNHPSAHEVYMAVRDQFQTISFATIYNTLETLNQKGLLNKLTIDPARSRYDYDTTIHYHLMCDVCGELRDGMEPLDIKVHENSLDGFEITKSNIEFKGICNKCKSKEVNTDGNI